jgi:hypothetical protein
VTIRCPLCGVEMEVVADGVARVHSCAGLEERASETFVRLRYMEIDAKLDEKDRAP